MRKIAIFASGSGSNAQKIADFFKKNKFIDIDCILSNKSDAFVLERAKQLGIQTYVFRREEFIHDTKVLKILQSRSVDFIVLAGFLWLIPSYLIKAYPNRIINIHPALLPKFGGKGMYGINVHRAVIEAGEKESGITIHYVNENYDEGNIIFQAKCSVEKDDTPEILAKRVHALEYKYFPKVIEQVVKGLENSNVQD